MDCMKHRLKLVQRFTVGWVLLLTVCKIFRFIGNCIIFYTVIRSTIIVVTNNLYNNTHTHIIYLYYRPHKCNLGSLGGS